MQQRQLRLGDILDDYCPRERRLTNHAVVAMVGELVRQTRCTTCDTEHPYKAAKIPLRRKKTDSAAGAYEEVLASVNKKDGESDLAKSNGDGQAPGEADTGSLPADQPAVGALPDGPVHRPLIRATLPRTDNPQVPRPVPEFTVRQMSRPGTFQSRAPGARFPKGQSRGPAGQDGYGRGPGGPRGPGQSARSGHPPQGPGMRSGPPQHRRPAQGFRPRKKGS